MFLSAIDALTAEIIVNGRVEIIRRGAKANEFVRKLETCLGGNETLEKAWLLYAQWAHNADVQKKRYYWFNWTIMLFGIAATFLTVLQTFLLLVWAGGRPVTIPSEFTAEQVLWFFLRWSVVFCPITITVLQAVYTKENTDAKWVKLYAAAENLLSEIYKYRTRTLEYSIERIGGGEAAPNDRAAGGAAGGGPGPEAEGPSKALVAAGASHASTREERLQQVIHTLTDSLSNSEVASVTLVPYAGSLPPRVIKRAGDDGFSDLGPDQYKRLRLDSRMAALEKRVKKEGHQLVTAATFLTSCSALGTVFAALAAYGFGYLQAWVALTTCLAGATNQWLDFTRVVFMQRRINIAIFNLGNVAVWWVGQGADADNKANRDRLVSETEQYILEETTLVGKMVLGSSHAHAQAEPAESEGEPQKAAKEAAHAQKAQLASIGNPHGLELEDLAGNRLAAALKNPFGAEAKAISGTLKKLQSLGLAPDTTRRLRPDQPAQGESAGIPPKAGGKPAAGVPDRVFVAPEAFYAAQHADTRDKLLRGMLRANDGSKYLNRWSILAVTATVPAVHQAVKDLRTRDLLEVAKAITVEKLFAVFLDDEHYESTTPPIHLRRADLIPVGSPGVSVYYAEVFLSEMQAVAKTEGSLALSANSLVNIVKDPAVKELFRLLPSAAKLRLRDAADHLWNASGPDATHAATVALLDDLVDLIADIDVDVFLENPEIRVTVWSSLSRFPQAASQAQPLSIPRNQLLMLFPAPIRSRIEAQPPMQIQKYAYKLCQGTPAARSFRFLHHKYDDLLKARADAEGTDESSRPAARGPAKIFHPAGDSALRERLVLAVGTIDQNAVNRMSRGMLIRKLRLCPVYNDSVDAVFRSLREQELRFFLSAVQARLSATYACRLVDRAADDIFTFDARSMLSYPDCEKLVSRIKEFRMASFEGGAAEKVSSLSTADVMKVLEFKSLTEALGALAKEQLHELIENLIALSSRSYPVQ
eukprot:gene8011-12325_t